MIVSLLPNDANRRKPAQTDDVPAFQKPPKEKGLRPSQSWRPKVILVEMLRDLITTEDQNCGQHINVCFYFCFALLEK